MRKLSTDTGRGLLISIGVMMAIGTIHDLVRPHVYWNGTPSLPYGLYLKTNDQKAPDVIFCSPEKMPNPLPGICPDGEEPLMKPYVDGARRVEFTPGGFVIDGKPQPNTRAKEKDHLGRPLKHIPYGAYTPDANRFWGISTYTDQSFDSRYFGPISNSAIISRARPLLTF